MKNPDFKDFKPLSFKKFKKEFNIVKKSNNENKESRYYSLLKKIQIEGISDILYCSSGSVPYFLDDIDKVEMKEKYDGSEDEDGEKWKTLITENNDWQKQINKMKHKNQNEPFEISFSYGDEKFLEKSGIINSENFGTKIYYIPKQLETEVERYNKYTEGNINKQAEDEFASLTKNINFNQKTD